MDDLPFLPDEVIIRLDDYRVQFQRDGAGIVMSIVEPSGARIAWDRLSDTSIKWLTEVLR